MLVQLCISALYARKRLRRHQGVVRTQAPAQVDLPGLGTTQAGESHPETSLSPCPRSARCQACGATPLPSKLVCRSCFKEYAADRESEGQQVTDLLKKVVKDSLAGLISAVPTQQMQSPSQEGNESLSLPGPSTMEPLHTRLVNSTRQTEGNAQSDESSDDPETAGFSFSLVQPYVQAVKLAIGWEEADAPSKRKIEKLFSFSKKVSGCLSLDG